MSQYEEELRLAQEIARRTWEQIAHFYDQPIDVETKVDGTPVTIADKTSNRLIIERIRKAFPNDSIVSEEEEEVKGGRRTWYIDPIDGTKGFIKRNGHFAIHIGFCEENTPVMGVVYAAALGDMYSGVVGQGAWRDNSRGRVNLRVRDISRQSLIASTNGDHPQRDLEHIFGAIGVGEYHNCGSEGLRLIKIAENRTDIRINEAHNGTGTWDVCAPHAVIAAAGAIVKHLDGSEIVYSQQRKIGKRYVAATTPELLERTIRAYNASLAPLLPKGRSDDEKSYGDVVYNEHSD